MVKQQSAVHPYKLRAVATLMALAPQGCNSANLHQAHTNPLPVNPFLRLRSLLQADAENARND
jgi:hypothetical protein